MIKNNHKNSNRERTKSLFHHFHLSNRREWTCWCTGQKGCKNCTNTYQRNTLPFLFFTVSPCIL